VINMDNNSLLIVDDDVSKLIELTQILRSEYKLYTAKDGASALEIAGKNLPDMILLDIIMPGMSGFDVLANLKKNESTKDIPVIFMTGISETDNECTGLSLGAVDYFRKPFDAEVIKLRIKHQMQVINLIKELKTRQPS